MSKQNINNVKLGKDVKIFDFVNLYGCSIDNGTKIGTFVEIQKNTFIGKNCKIGPHAYIRKGTIIGDNCEIGRAEVKGSVIMNGVKAHHHCYIGDSIIGDNVNIGAGVVLTNFKLGGKMIKLGDVEIGRKFMSWVFARARRQSSTVEKYELPGLTLFVAIPLPFTGAWTGSIVAFLLGIKFWPAFLHITLGVLIAGVIVTTLCLLGWTGAIIAGIGLCSAFIIGWLKSGR